MQWGGTAPRYSLAARVTPAKMHVARPPRKGKLGHLVSYHPKYLSINTFILKTTCKGFLKQK